MDRALAQAQRCTEKIQHIARKRRRPRLRIPAPNHHRKLIASHTGQHSAVRHPFTQRASHHNNQLIAHIVAVNIIHIFKTVEIDKHHAFDIAIAAQTDLLQRLDQRAAIG
ncbi:hypothetical protein D3C76_1220100 [compost metagenome]